jgi:hypothetical protein
MTGICYVLAADRWLQCFQILPVKAGSGLKLERGKLATTIHARPKEAAMTLSDLFNGALNVANWQPPSMGVLLLGVLALLFGWRLSKKTIGLAGCLTTGIVSVLPGYMTLAAGCLLTGLVSIGFGAAELNSIPSNPQPYDYGLPSPAAIAKMTSEIGMFDSKERFQIATKWYADQQEFRRSAQPAPTIAAEPTHGSRHLGMVAVLGGIGLVLLSIVTVVQKVLTSAKPASSY